MGVKALHPDYTSFSPKWKRCRDVIAGQDAMHKAGPLYLPKLKDEEDRDYKARVARSDFFNGTWRTIDALSGMAFRKSPTVDVPSGVESHLDDINMAGMPMHSMAKETVEEVLSVGRFGILVDHPALPENVTTLSIAAAEKLGMRPTLQAYPTESIRNWKYARINNAWVLTMVVLGETEAVAKDEFEDTLEDRYRVLDLAISAVEAQGYVYRQRVFMVNAKGEDVLLSEFVPLMDGRPLDYIPFAIIGAGGRSDAIDEPPLIDLVDKNVAHYQVNSDYRHGLHFTGLPTPYVAGYTNPNPEKPEKFYIGSTTAWTFTDPNAKVGFLEFTGQGLEAIEKALDRIERQMAMLGARMIADEGKQAETLGATQIKRAGENSVLSKIVEGVSEALEWVLGIFAQWAGQKGEITYQISREFLPTMMDAQTLTALVGAVQSGNLSKQEFFDLLQRGDVIDGEKTYEEHQEEIDSSPPPAPAKPKPGEEMAA
jgi:hypothetical protein